MTKSKAETHMGAAVPLPEIGTSARTAVEDAEPVGAGLGTPSVEAAASAGEDPEARRFAEEWVAPATRCLRDLVRAPEPVQAAHIAAARHALRSLVQGAEALFDIAARFPEVRAARGAPCDLCGHRVAARYAMAMPYIWDPLKSPAGKVTRRVCADCLAVLVTGKGLSRFASYDRKICETCGDTAGALGEILLPAAEWSPIYDPLKHRADVCGRCAVTLAGGATRAEQVAASPWPASGAKAPHRRCRRSVAY